MGTIAESPISLTNKEEDPISVEEKDTKLANVEVVEDSYNLRNDCVILDDDTNTDKNVTDNKLVKNEVQILEIPSVYINKVSECDLISGHLSIENKKDDHLKTEGITI